MKRPAGRKRPPAAAEVAAHQSAAEAAIESHSEELADAWELALEGSGELVLPEVAELLFGGSSSTQCYSALALLESAEGRCLFRARQSKSSDTIGFGTYPTSSYAAPPPPPP